MRRIKGHRLISRYLSKVGSIEHLLPHAPKLCGVGWFNLAIHESYRSRVGSECVDREAVARRWVYDSDVVRIGTIAAAVRAA